ncbi:Smc5-Smc6 complex subunit NSE4 NDAI_0B03280 [Naumovozyma dairenensis CBS 421]|uniref:Non-structural maintenance of chromosomes element 4 n=1 Tax=Naumovozyma dairenensis (strain ATCC 10597 / BCRC 20456 / CBS 421 / NBRC 0211 / NRRL Y-12639) TaxID=1071378 RepID=G0W6F1_NAUDC|nr:hypothetical protein NDAI_0B03280 [Naumovozyma dairenensis CBS 421]CCD23362.1 hypothetical protein NDAI_0B03280 [Naumovozyma dairenensis CBS 421]
MSSYVMLCYVVLCCVNSSHVSLYLSQSIKQYFPSHKKTYSRSYMSTTKRSQDHSSNEHHRVKRTKLLDNDTNDDDDAEATTGMGRLEFEALQQYREFEDKLITDRAEAIRTGDINIVINSLDNVNGLFSKVNGSKNNGLFAHDAKAIVNISELAQISVRNLKFGDTRSLINIDDITNYFKRYMLKEYFKLNRIKEEESSADNLLSSMELTNDENEDNDGANTRNNNKLRQNVMKKNYLKQFNRYDQFNEFNWFRMGALFENFSSMPITVDHLSGPFALEKKIRAPIVRKRRVEPVGKLTKAEVVTQENLKTKEPTTPEQVKRIFKILQKKIGQSNNNNNSINLFEFIIDPNSFCRTVENLFYTSFLIKEGRLELIENESDGFPSIRIKENVRSNDSANNEIEKQKRLNKHQNHIIFQIDMPTWKKLIEKFSITESFIPSFSDNN